MIKELISICICTYKRQSLLDTLNSIESQVIANKLQLELCIVDNDSKGSSLPIVESFRRRSKLTIHHKIEPRQGLSFARNATLKQASGKWLAFIDDDEVAATDWISKLYSSAISYDADVIIGRVKTIYPKSTPVWLLKGDFFGRTFPKTGCSLEVAGIGNALIKRSSLPVDMLFDTRFNQTGGEDTDLLYRMTLANKKIIACREACVSETVEEHRLNKDFLLKKALGVGETYQLIIVNRKNPLIRCGYLMRSFLQWFLASGVSLLTRPFDKINSIRFEIKANANKGKVLAFFVGEATKLYTEKK